MEFDIENFYKQISKNVQRKRIELGKTQSELSYCALNLNNSCFFSKMENCSDGKHFNLEHLFNLSIYLQCDIRDFFEGVSNNAYKKYPQN